MTNSRRFRPQPGKARCSPAGQSVGVTALGVIPLMVLVLALVSGCALGTSFGDHAGPPCNKKRMAMTTDFADRTGGRIGEMDDGSEEGPQDVCFVFLLISKGAGADPMEIIDQGVRSGGWKRKGDATWVNPHGFEVTARDDSESTDPNAPQTAEYEIMLWGKAAG